VFLVDTNLLLYAVNPDAADHARSRALLEQWRRGDRLWFLTWGIIYEFLRVSTHGAVFPQPLALVRAQEWIELLLSGPCAGLLEPTNRHLAVLAEVTALHPRLRGNVIHDMHTAVLMREHGVTEIRTADTDFHQFTFLTVVNPLIA
jgi:toxin-antitoxin system PIN domain toxin